MDDVFDQLRRSPDSGRWTPEPLADLRRRTARRRQRRRLQVAAAAVAVLVPVVAVLAQPRDGDGTEVQIVTPPTVVVPRPEPEVEPPEPSTSVRYSGPPLAVASDRGVEVVRSDGTVDGVWDVPSVTALLVGDIVVAQGRDAHPDSRFGAAPITVIAQGTARDLPLGDEALRLHDAGVVDGRVVAVATSRTGLVGPDDTDERLLLIDVETGDRTDLGSVGGWEWGVSRARLVGDMLVVEGGYAELETIDLRRLDGDVIWEVSRQGYSPLVPAGPDLVRIDWVYEEGWTEVVQVDASTGDDVGRHLVRSDECMEVDWSGRFLVCSRAGSAPVLIDPATGSAADFGLASGTATVDRTAVVDAVDWASFPGQTCDPAASIAAEVDGDGRPDLVVHEFDDRGAVLRACLASGEVFERPGLGQAEILEVVDVDGDGLDEILYGATSGTGAGRQIAVLADVAVDGLGRRLQGVRNDGGSALAVLRDGGTLLDRINAQREVTGCEDGRFVQIVGTRHVDDVAWVRVDLVLDRARATVSVESILEGDDPLPGEGEDWVPSAAAPACEVRR